MAFGGSVGLRSVTGRPAVSAMEPWCSTSGVGPSRCRPRVIKPCRAIAVPTKSKAPTVIAVMGAVVARPAPTQGSGPPPCLEGRHEGGSPCWEARPRPFRAVSRPSIPIGHPVYATGSIPTPVILRPSAVVTATGRSPRPPSVPWLPAVPRLPEAVREPARKVEVTRLARGAASVTLQQPPGG